MTGLHKNRLKTIFIAFVIIILNTAITSEIGARHINSSEIYSTLTPDTIPVKKKDSILISRSDSTIINNNTTIVARDTTVPRVDTFSLRLSKDTLDAPVNYEAEDSAVLLVKDKKFILYGKTKTTHKDIVLTAPKVEMDQATNVFTAYSDKDSLGNVMTRAKFVDGQQNFESDTIRFNFKTQRGLTVNTYTVDGEILINMKLSKKVNQNTVFGREGYFTTCLLDEPHFAFKTNKLKIISNKVAVSGPTHPEFEGVPVPIYLPFGFFPLKTGRHSGLLPPQFTANEDFGLGLEGLGYYHVINDYYDVRVQGNIYSYGGWNASLTPSYRKRYRYNGQVNLAIQHTKLHFKGDPDFQVGNTYAFSWNHAVDQRARPGTNFSANVNISSSKYNQFVPNNAARNFQNTLTSSIAYSKRWADKPYNLQLNAGHDQNNLLRLINIRLPEGSFSVNTLYPFQKKDLVGTPKWYEKLGIGYNTTFRNQISFYDTAQITAEKLLDTMQWGARHAIPISLSLPPLGKFIVSPSISYEEQWLQSRIQRAWNPALQKVDTISMQRGFFTDRQVSFGVGMNTAIFGTVLFKNSRVVAIRHVIRPSISANYKPNLSRSKYDFIQVDPSGRKFPQAQLIGGYGYGRFGGLSFGVDNNLEMKVRSKKDTGDAAIKKVRLIEGFNISSGYNFLEDSLRLQPFNISFRSTLFDKVNITGQAYLDPYAVDSFGIRVNRFVWQGDRFSLPRTVNASLSMSTSFKSKPRDGDKKPVEKNPEITDPALLGDRQRMAEYMQRNPAEFVDFNVPYSLDLSFSLIFSKAREIGTDNFKTTVTSNVSFNNSFSLTPKWNFTTNGYYDFTTKKLTSLNVSISRDMHCWQLSASVIPIGSFRSFNITISPKASILQDLKVNRTRVFSDY